MQALCPSKHGILAGAVKRRLSSGAISDSSAGAEALNVGDCCPNRCCRRLTLAAKERLRADEGARAEPEVPGRSMKRAKLSMNRKLDPSHVGASHDALHLPVVRTRVPIRTQAGLPRLPTFRKSDFPKHLDAAYAM